MMDVVAADFGQQPGQTPHDVLLRFQTVAARLLKISTPEEVEILETCGKTGGVLLATPQGVWL
eukprot:2819725-Amphidinium_carterae.2